MVKYLLTFLLILLSNPLKAEEISGSAKIIDGDTIYIENYKIRLEGIDAPEIKQKCKKPYLQFSFIVGLTFNKSYDCGIVSKKELKNKINNSIIKCTYSSKDRYKRYLATCYTNKVNLNKWMVRKGYAVAYKRYSKKYLIDEKYAESNKLGLWRGSFERPEIWRKLN